MLIERASRIIVPNLSIAKSTTPVLYFGNYDKAKSCTISLNPSDREFCDKHGELLEKNNERLCSRKKLGKNDDEELSIDEAKQVIASCNTYFLNRPYKSWFNKYEEFLKIFGLSYYDGSVVHLDLVQWATTPFWGGLGNTTKESLLSKDLPFLKALLEKNFEYVFLNGRTVVEEVSGRLNIKLEAKRIKIRGNRNLNIYTGKYSKSKVIGWSLYLQSAGVGGYDNIHEIAKAVKEESGRHPTTIST